MSSVLFGIISSSVSAVIVCFADTDEVKTVPHRPGALMLPEKHVLNSMVFVVRAAIKLYDSNTKAVPGGP